MTNLEFLLRKRENLNNQLNGILAGMCDGNEHEVAQKIKRITVVINKVKRQRREKKCQ